jgi:MFS transporter, SP family, sugar:H+ symporter
LISTYQLFITLGIFLAACFNFGTYEHQRNNSGSWRIVIAIGWVFTGILGVGILFFPETPRHDYRRGRVEKARETMVKVFGAPPHHYAVHTELEEIEAKLRAEDQITHGPVREYLNMFRAPRMAYRIALGCVLQMFQQLTGANYFFYYGMILRQAMLLVTSELTMHQEPRYSQESASTTRTSRR